jgi:CO/xanthine dehydrogenase FAD-binding subunit
VADRIIDAAAAVQGLIGQAWTAAAAEQLELRCPALVKQPLSDQQGSGEWRQAMAGVVARRAMAAAVARAGQK